MLIVENQIVVITGRAGSGKSLVCAQAALDFLKKKQINCIYNTRAAIEVGRSLGFLPGDINGKFDPYMEALIENLAKCCSDKNEVPKLIEDGKVKALPVQFIRGKTIDDILIVEEAQNLTKGEMLAILTRLGKNGKIVINGDNEQTDINSKTGEINGLSYVIELSKLVKLNGSTIQNLTALERNQLSLMVSASASVCSLVLPSHDQVISWFLLNAIVIS